MRWWEGRIVLSHQLFSPIRHPSSSVHRILFLLPPTSDHCSLQLADGVDHRVLCSHSRVDIPGRRLDYFRSRVATDCHLRPHSSADTDGRRFLRSRLSADTCSRNILCNISPPSPRASTLPIPSARSGRCRGWGARFGNGGRLAAGGLPEIARGLAMTTMSATDAAIVWLGDCEGDISGRRGQRTSTSYLEPVASRTYGGNVHRFPSPRGSSSWGFHKFIRHDELERSGHLTGDRFAVRCDVTVMRATELRVEPACLAVPEPDLRAHLRRLLSTGDGADVTFRVGGGETFAAHRCVLAARSPVFKAELCGRGGAAAGRCVDVDDMGAGEFGALLHFVYTDTLLEMASRDVPAMARRLIAAAGKYQVERLKLVCEDMLRRRVDTSMAMATTTDSAATTDDQLSQRPWLTQLFFKFASRMVGGMVVDAFTPEPPTAAEKSGDASPSLSPSPSCSTVAVSEASGHHVLRIEGYKRTKMMMATGEHLNSGEFHVGGYTWRLRYYPNRYDQEFSSSISFALVRTGRDDDDVVVRARVKISLLDVAGEPVTRYSHSDNKCTFYEGHDLWAIKSFIRRVDLEDSGHLDDGGGGGDSFAVRCDLTFNVPDIRVDVDDAAAVTVPAVPPPLLHRHLGDLLASEAAADVRFNVDGEAFAAHRCILAARSPVFRAELFGSMRERAARAIVRVDDMDADAFAAFLHFVYTDELPEMDDDGEEAAAVMAKHLLVAADRYGMERLKKVCEDVLFRHVVVATAATSLALAEQHDCPELKDAILRFVTSPARLKADMASDGYEHLITSFPSIATEILAMLAAQLST
ncbi:hypothetical protein OsJ_34524 [Oryza sativa Japonica Group]|uniref:BTB/POZ domain containing protein n=3 Tax=Oryza sativa subsp. japonica TaxID=39947 RepID=B9G8E8_ORYSJ|nr:hypothetical protein OsJ_34524 [Oryza sativa Japonica Group]